MVWACFDRSQRGQVPHYEVESTAELRYLGTSWDEKNYNEVLGALLTSPLSDPQGPSTSESLSQRHSHRQQIIIQYRPGAFHGISQKALRKFLCSLASCSFKVSCKTRRKILAKRQRTRGFHARTDHPGVRVHVILHRSFERPLAGRSLPALIISPLSQLITLWVIMIRSHDVYVTSEKTIGPWHRLFSLRRRAIKCLPVPSHITLRAEPEKVGNLRRAMAPLAESFVLGTFSSFMEPQVLSLLGDTLVQLLRRNPRWVWLAFGRYSRDYVRFLQGRYHNLADRMQWGGELDLLALSAHLQVCDVALQPYHLGVSTLRTSAMASLSHGVPLVTSLGRNTEKIWQKSRCAHLVPWKDGPGYVQAVEELARDSRGRRNLGERGLRVYRENFSLEKNIDVLYGSGLEHQ